MVVLPVIRMNNLKKAFGDRLIFENLELSIAENSIVGVFGASGIGKSTLAKILCGVLRPDEGAVYLENRLLCSSTRPYDRKLGLQIQMVYQQPYAALDPHQPIGDGFRELIRYHHMASNGRDCRKLTEQVLRQVALPEEILAHRPHQISGGEAQRIAIARSLLFEPRLLILDEATSMLDVSTQANVMGLVRRVMAAREGSVLLISHDWDMVQFLCDQIYVFDNKTLKKEK